MRHVNSRNEPGRPSADAPGHHSRAVRSRIALPITLTEDSAIAAAAMIGESRMPKIGYSTPAWDAPSSFGSSGSGWAYVGTELRFSGAVSA